MPISRAVKGLISSSYPVPFRIHVAVEGVSKRRMRCEDVD